MAPRTEHRLLIYYLEAKAYEAILSKRLPELKIHSASKPEEAWEAIGETEILLSWKIPDELLKRAKNLAWFASTAAGRGLVIGTLALQK